MLMVIFYKFKVDYVEGNIVVLFCVEVVDMFRDVLLRVKCFWVKFRVDLYLVFEG